MREEKDFVAFEKYMSEAYKDMNFFDSQNKVDELVKRHNEQKVIAFIRKAIAVRKLNDRNRDEAIKKIDAQFKPRDAHLWEDALNWVTHKQKGRTYIFL